MVPIPVAAVMEAAPAPFAISALPACAAGALTLSFDREGGALDGAGRAGALMVVRNTGAAPCRLAALPRVAFAAPGGAPLPVRFRPPAGMHPGPAVPPVGVAPGAEVTAELRWTPAPVGTGGRCFDAAAARVSFDGVALDAPFQARFCGTAVGATFGQAWLRADARLKP